MDNKTDDLVDSFYVNGIAVDKNFLSEAGSAQLLNILQSKESSMKPAGIGKANDYSKIKEIRSDKIAWLEKNENELLDKLFFARVEELELALNRRCFLGLNDHEFHFAKYEPGTFYKRHKDVFRSDDARKISMILYLNKNWQPKDGGQLKIYKDNSELIVEPKAGTLVIFESHIEHEVLISNNDRYSVTGWMKSVKDIL
jgi:SM-20-related protein